MFAARFAAPAAAVLAVAVTPSPAAAPRSLDVRAVTVAYRSHTGALEHAVVLVPKRYGGEPLPLVISPHGRGATGRANAALWRNLPALGGFAVVNPDGAGRRLGRFSWG